MTSSLPKTVATPDWAGLCQKLLGDGENLCVASRIETQCKMQSEKYEVQIEDLHGILHFVFFTLHCPTLIVAPPCQELFISLSVSKSSRQNTPQSSKRLRLQLLPSQLLKSRYAAAELQVLVEVATAEEVLIEKRAMRDRVFFDRQPLPQMLFV